MQSGYIESTKLNIDYAKDICLSKDENTLFVAALNQGIKVLQLQHAGSVSDISYYEPHLVAEAATKNANAVGLSADEKLILVADKEGGLSMIDVVNK